METARLNDLLQAGMAREDFVDELRTHVRRTGTPASEVLEHVERVARSFRRVSGDRDDRDELLVVARNLAETYENFGDLIAGVETYREALSLARDLGNRNAEADILRKLGRAHRKQSRWDEALASVEEGRGIFVELGDEAGQALCRISEGIVSAERGHYAAASDAYRYALELAERLDLPRVLVSATQNLGIIETILGNLSEAQNRLQQALSVAEQNGYAAARARALHNLGMCHSARESWSEALDAFESALADAEHLGTLELSGAACVQKAAVYLRLSDSTLTASYCARALDIFTATDDPLGQAEAFKVLGALMTARGATTTARDLLEESLALCRRFESPLNEAETRVELGRLARALERPQAARDQLEQAAAVFERLGARRHHDNALALLSSL